MDRHLVLHSYILFQYHHLVSILDRTQFERCYPPHCRLQFLQLRICRYRWGQVSHIVQLNLERKPDSDIIYFALHTYGENQSLAKFNENSSLFRSTSQFQGIFAINNGQRIKKQIESEMDKFDFRNKSIILCHSIDRNLVLNN